MLLFRSIPWSSAPARSPRAWVQGIALDLHAAIAHEAGSPHWLEVLICHPGVQALLLHRLAHALHRRRWPLVPRLISQVARLLTGVEIHPGAQIGQGVVILHGMGVVIGETAMVGDDVLIHQDVTLGGTGKETGKRHPTLGRGVVVEAGAKVLGNLHIGQQARICASAVVLRDVPAHCTVTGIPGHITHSPHKAEQEAAPTPDSKAAIIRSLVNRLEALEQQVQAHQRPTVASPRPRFASVPGSTSEA